MSDDNAESTAEVSSSLRRKVLPSARPKRSKFWFYAPKVSALITALFFPFMTYWVQEIDRQQKINAATINAAVKTKTLTFEQASSLLHDLASKEPEVQKRILLFAIICHREERLPKGLLPTLVFSESITDKTVQKFFCEELLAMASDDKYGNLALEAYAKLLEGGNKNALETSRIQAINQVGPYLLTSNKTTSKEAVLPIQQELVKASVDPAPEIRESAGKVLDAQGLSSQDQENIISTLPSSVQNQIPPRIYTSAAMEIIGMDKNMAQSLRTELTQAGFVARPIRDTVEVPDTTEVRYYKSDSSQKLAEKIKAILDNTGKFGTAQLKTLNITRQSSRNSVDIYSHFEVYIGKKLPVASSLPH